MSTVSRERMFAGWPVTERRVELAGVPTTICEDGNGPQVLVLHGGIECGAAIWTRVGPALASRYRVVLPDAPGLGESAPAPRLDPATFCTWLDALIDSAFDEPPALVAHSLLGNYTARFAIERGHRLGGLVICSAPGIGRYRVPLALRAAGLPYAIRPSPGNAARFQRFALLDRARTRDADRDWFDAFGEYCLERASRRHVKATMGRLLKEGTKRIPTAELSRIPARTAMLWGRDDRMTPLSVVEPVAEELGWPLRVVDGAAHVPQIEQPERFVEALDGLLST